MPSPTIKNCLATLMLLATGWAFAHDPAPAPKDEGKLIVHEWGTFLAMQGSDGVALGGMVDSEEQLPSFVRERSLGGRKRQSLNSKMETPVTYFYVDRPRTVEVRVDMADGLLTHWFPAVDDFGSYGCRGYVGSYLNWGKFQLIPEDRPIVGPPKPDPYLLPAEADSTWKFARQTDSAFVKVDRKVRETAGGWWTVPYGGEAEKFLFYRGVGTLKLPLEVRSETVRSGLRLMLHNRNRDALRGIFVVQVAQDAIRFEAVPDLAGDGSEPFYLSASPQALPLKVGVPQVKQAVAAALVKAGLYDKEATAMVNTWEKSYFRTEGLRVLYILPRDTVDATIPIQIKPAPQELERVMVGRVEVLTPDDECRLEQAVANVESADIQKRKAAETELARLGRFKEPVLHRIATLTSSTEVRDRAEVLIKKAAQ